MNDRNVTTKPEQPAALCSSDLLACPHCGDSYVSLLSEIPGGGCQAMCRGCGARSGVGKEMDVINEWNRRAGHPITFCFCPRCGVQMNPKHDSSASHEDLALIGAKWKQNSSLEEWFPFSAQKLKSLEAEVGSAAAIIVKQNQAIERLKEAGDSLARHTREAKAIHGIDGDACADNWDDAKQANDPSSESAGLKR